MMGYFANGMEGMRYEEKYCDHCIHAGYRRGCPCLDAHILWGYEESNKKDSILHKMIPFTDGENGQCIFFEYETDR
jgi:hypothetical protein